MKKLETAFALVTALSFGGCVPPPQAGAPIALTFPNDANPDTIWVVRPVSVERRSFGNSGRPILYGLFACYRMKTPEPPKCFLAKTDADAGALVWPDDPKDYALPGALKADTGGR